MFLHCDNKRCSGLGFIHQGNEEKGSGIAIANPPLLLLSSIKYKKSEWDESAAPILSARCESTVFLDLGPFIVT
jgi:hypothetical protein